MRMEFERTSVIDSVGKVFYEGERVFRKINSDKIGDVEKMFSIGLIEELNSKGMIPYTRRSYVFPMFEYVLEHQRIEDPSYIQEWSFEMIRAVALFLLDLEEVLLKYGYTLKDCHSYNVMFCKNQPTYVDIGSFIPFTELGYATREYYANYDQIMEMFIYDSSIARERLMSQHHLGARYNYYYLHGVKNGVHTFSDLDDKLCEIARINSIEQAATLIESERLKIGAYKRNEASIWGKYQDNYYYNAEDMVSADNRRFSRIVELCEMLAPSSILELGANQGVLSKLLSRIEGVERLYATDYDEEAIDKLYRSLTNTNCSDACFHNIIPSVYDFTKDICLNISYKPFENRYKSELVIACAMSHHLILGQHINIKSIFEKLSRLTSRYVLIEFMPMGLWGGGEYPKTPDWYTQGWFEKTMREYFNILRIEELSLNRIAFLAEKYN